MHLNLKLTRLDLAKTIKELSEGDEISVLVNGGDLPIISVVFCVIGGEILITNTGRVIREDSEVLVTPTGTKHKLYPVCDRAVNQKIKLMYYLPHVHSPTPEPE